MKEKIIKIISEALMIVVAISLSIFIVAVIIPSLFKLALIIIFAIIIFGILYSILQYYKVKKVFQTIEKELKNDYNKNVNSEKASDNTVIYIETDEE